MALRLAPPEGLEGMDRQIFDIIDDGDGHQIITAFNPVARLALLGYHGCELTTSLGCVAEIVLKEKDYRNHIKGKISEMNITCIKEALNWTNAHFKSFETRLEDAGWRTD